MSAVLLLPVLLPVTVGLLAYVLLTDSPRHRAMMALVAAATVLVSILAVLPSSGPERDSRSPSLPSRSASISPHRSPPAPPW